jgi:hypothetical protein
MLHKYLREELGVESGRVDEGVCYSKRTWEREISPRNLYSFSPSLVRGVFKSGVLLGCSL